MGIFPCLTEQALNDKMSCISTYADDLGEGYMYVPMYVCIYIVGNLFYLHCNFYLSSFSEKKLANWEYIGTNIPLKII
jgi:hypothetical protein